MYKCKECGTQYKTKPQYCDCGNDVFDFIEEKPTKQPLTLEQKSQIVSVIFFVICLIFAISVWCIPIPQPQPKTKSTPAKTTPEQNIPNINKIWNDTPIYQPVQQQKEQQTEVINRNEPIRLTPTPVDYARHSN